MINSDESQLIERLISSFNSNNEQINELVRLQDELSRSESELLALQLRFVHKYSIFNSKKPINEYSTFKGPKKIKNIWCKSKKKLKNLMKRRLKYNSNL